MSMWFLSRRKGHRRSLYSLGLHPPLLLGVIAVALALFFPLIHFLQEVLHWILKVPAL